MCVYVTVREWDLRFASSNKATHNIPKNIFNVSKEMRESIMALISVLLKVAYKRKWHVANTDKGH